MDILQFIGSIGGIAGVLAFIIFPNQTSLDWGLLA